MLQLLHLLFLGFKLLKVACLLSCTVLSFMEIVLLVFVPLLLKLCYFLSSLLSISANVGFAAVRTGSGPVQVYWTRTSGSLLPGSTSDLISDAVILSHHAQPGKTGQAEPTVLIGTSISSSKYSAPIHLRREPSRENLDPALHDFGSTSHL